MPLELLWLPFVPKKDIRANIGKFQNGPFFEKMARG